MVIEGSPKQVAIFSSTFAKLFVFVVVVVARDALSAVGAFGRSPFRATEGNSKEKGER